MILAIPTLAADLPPVALRAGVGQAIASALQAHDGVTADMLPIAFDGVQMEDVADTEVGEGDIASLDAWVAQALAQALDAESPAYVLPALQNGTQMPSHLAQALEARGEVIEQALPRIGQVDAQRHVGQAVPQAPQGFGMQPQAELVEVSKVQTLAQPGSAPATPVRDTGATALTQAAMSASNTVSAAGDAQPMPSTGMTVPEGFSRLGALMAEPAADAAQTPTARNAEPTQAQQKLLDALGERLSVQTHQGMRHAVIRLDPYMSGSVRIELRQEANGIAVHLSATNADVVRQLQAIGESLRQDLGARNGGDVTVQVSASRPGHGEQDTSGHRERHAREQEEEHTPGHALVSAGGDRAFELASREVTRMQKEST